MHPSPLVRGTEHRRRGLNVSGGRRKRFSHVLPRSWRGLTRDGQRRGQISISTRRAVEGEGGFLRLQLPLRRSVIL